MHPSRGVIAGCLSAMVGIVFGVSCAIQAAHVDGIWTSAKVGIAVGIVGIVTGLSLAAPAS